jgi:transketolase
MAVLFFDRSGMHYDPSAPEKLSNDRFVLSKGHASPILFAVWAHNGYLPM